MRDKKIKGKNRGGEGTTPVTTACPEAGKKKCEEKKKKKKINAYVCIIAKFGVGDVKSH